MYESAPWRTELRKHALVLRDAPSWPSEDGKFFDIDRALFYSAFVLRKLIEDKKLSEVFCKSCLTVKTILNISASKDSFWRNKPGSVELDPRSISIREIPIFEICNQIIHCMTIYGWGDTKDEVTGYFISSYKQQDSYSILIGFNEWANLLMNAADDWPTQSAQVVKSQGVTATEAPDERKGRQGRFVDERGEVTE